MLFMQPQIERDLWVEIDGNCGIDVFPASIVAWPDRLLASDIADGASWTNGDDDDGLFEELCKSVSDYTENNPFKIRSIEIRSGYGARLSASGYMDCTPWMVFDTEAEAREYLAEQYSEEELED